MLIENHGNELDHQHIFILFYFLLNYNTGIKFIQIIIRIVLFMVIMVTDGCNKMFQIRELDSHGKKIKNEKKDCVIPLLINITFVILLIDLVTCDTRLKNKVTSISYI